ncbi:hypothetical protein HYW35_03080 [Candidatus Saccharibacteria bacterium]|nr:hypothetical protein [Candidatus Saccharibacteria bacterium]
MGIGPEAHAREPQDTGTLDVPPGGYGWPQDGGSRDYLAYLASNDLKAHGESLTAIVNRAGGGVVEVGGGVRLIGPGVQVVGEGNGVSDGNEQRGGARHQPEHEPDWGAERQRIRHEERQRAEEEANRQLQERLGQIPTDEQIQQRIEDLVGQRIEVAKNEVRQEMQGQFEQQQQNFDREMALHENTIRDLRTELQQERDRHAAELADRDAEIARLNTLLQGGPLPPGPTAPQELTADQLQELHGQIDTARNDLVDITIRRKSRTFFDRFIPWRRGEQQEYNQALERYTTLMGRMQNQERAHRLAAGENEADIIETQENDVFGDLNNLAEEVYNVNRNRVRDVIQNGNFFRRNWARATWFLGNQSAGRKILAIAGLGAGVAVVSATAGLGLAFVAAGAGLKFSVSYFNNRSGVRNLAQHNLQREQARLQHAHQNLQNRRAGTAIDRRRAQMGSEFRQAHESNVRRDRLWNTIGKTAMLGGGLTVVYGVVAGLDGGLPRIPSILDAFRDHNNVTAAGSGTGVTGTEGTTGSGGATGPTGTEGVTGNGGATGATDTEGTSGTGSGTTGTTGTEGAKGITNADGNKEYYNPIFGNRSVGVEMPEGTHLLQNADGSYKITDNNGNALPGLDRVGWDTQGNLDKATRRFLTDHGYKLTQDTLSYKGTDGLTHQHFITDIENLTGNKTGNIIPGSSGIEGTADQLGSGNPPTHTATGSNISGQSLDVSPGKATPEQLSHTHIEFVPNDDHGGTMTTTAVRLQDGEHLHYAGHDSHGGNIVQLIDEKNRVLVKDLEFTHTGALSNHSILEANLYHGPNNPPFLMHTPYDKLHNPLYWSGRTISTLLDPDELSKAA